MATLAAVSVQADHTARLVRQVPRPVPLGLTIVALVYSMFRAYTVMDLFVPPDLRPLHPPTPLPVRPATTARPAPPMF